MKFHVTNVDDLVESIQEKYPWLKDVGCIFENGNAYIEIKDLEHLIKTMNEIDSRFDDDYSFKIHPYSHLFIGLDGEPIIRIYDDYIE